jgi:transposase
MINYRLKDSVVTHFPAIFKGLGSKGSVIHMALDVELHGGVLAVRVAGCRPIDCGKCSRSTVVDLARELLRRRHRVVLVEEACGFGYSFHRQLREIGVEAFVVATESLSGKRKTNRRDANKLLDQLYDFDVNGNKKALRPIRVPTLKEQKSRRLCRMRSQLIKVRNILEAQGRGLLFDFDFHDVLPGWWGPRKWREAAGQALRTRSVAHRDAGASPEITQRPTATHRRTRLADRAREPLPLAPKWPKVLGQPPLPL